MCAARFRATFLMPGDQGIIECFCGRQFSQDNAYGNHRRSCKRTKKRLSGVLDKAKDIFVQKKQKVSHVASTSAGTNLAQFPTVVEVYVMSVLVEYCANSI
jgi:hypothetical protein